MREIPNYESKIALPSTLQNMWNKQIYIGKYELNKHEIDKNGINKYWYLATFTNNCQCYNINSQPILGIWY